jgi:hypothetical protein
MGALSAAACVDQRSRVPQNSVRSDIAGSSGSQDGLALFAESNPAITSRSSLQETEVKQKVPIIPTNRLSQNLSLGDRGGCHRRAEDLRGKAHPELSTVPSTLATLYKIIKPPLGLLRLGARRAPMSRERKVASPWISGGLLFLKENSEGESRSRAIERRPWWQLPSREKTEEGE